MTAFEAKQGQVDVLRRVPLFSELDEETLSRLAERATEVAVPRGHVLLERGQEGSGLFIVLEGTVDIDLGDRRIEKGGGEILGELAVLVPGLRHTARVRAGSDLRCLAIRRDDFERLLEERPRIAVAMLPVLARRQAETLAYL